MVERPGITTCPNQTRPLPQQRVTDLTNDSNQGLSDERWQIVSDDLQRVHDGRDEDEDPERRFNSWER